MRDIVYEVKGLLPEAVVISIKDQLKITEDIDSEVDDAARNYGFYAVLAEKAETRHAKLKFAFDTWKAQLELRESMLRSAEGKKRLTVDQMKSFVMTQPKYLAYMSKLHDYEEHRRILKVIARAFEMKKDMIQTKSSNRRSEMVLKGGHKDE